MADLRGGTTIGGFTALHSGLTNPFLTGNLGVGPGAMGGPIAPIAGRAFLTIRGSGSTANGATVGVLELADSGSDVDGRHVGLIQASDHLSVASDKRVAGIAMYTDGTTANNRGGAITFLLKPDGSSGWVEKMRINKDGNVGIGAAPHATFKLNVAGDIQAAGWFRTVGQRGLFFQDYGGGWYMTDTTWIRNYGTKHVMLDATMQLGNGGLDYTPTQANWNTGVGSTLVLNALNYSTIAFHDSGARVDFIRVGTGIIELGYNGGWGSAQVRIPGRLVIPVGTDMYAT